MKNNRKIIAGKVFRWFLANAIFPIVIPLLVLLTGDLFFGSIVDFPIEVKKLLYEGFYIFSAMTLLFSLVEDFATFQKAVSPAAAMILMLPVMGTCMIFYATEKKGLEYFSSHLILFFVLWGALVLQAALIKTKITIYKLKYRY